MASNYFKVVHQNVDYSSIEKYLTIYIREIVAMGLTMAQTDEIINLGSEMLSEIHCFCKALTEKQPNDATKVYDNVFKHARLQLENVNTKYKRQKVMQSSIAYVEPEEKSSGFKWITETNKKTNQPHRNVIQSTFMYISIKKTLLSLFNNEDFEQLYLNYNRNCDHVCRENVYERFCCGDVYKQSDFFQSNPLAIQLKIFVDDVEPCDALKSKAGKHKITAFYMQINNLPSKYLSNLNSIYLLALCDASDLKNDYTNVNNVIETITADIKELETIGIKTKSGLYLKGTMACMTFDNLGGNILLGLSGSFSSNYYCRICTAFKADCQQMTKECIEALRTVSDYNECLAKLCEEDASANVKGVKSYCHLNDLQFFHTMKNITVDLMHDILEGIIPFVLEKLFRYCIANKIATLEKIQNLVECFNFGELYKQTIPSKINLERKNLGQNASQSYCLFIHIPYILFKFKDKLCNIWKPIETLLEILQIIYSHKINDIDLERFDQLVHEHLNSTKMCFEVSLKPKHHFLLHYARVIRSMGPVIFLWVMRMEAKHQFFKNIAHRTKNFINLKKTMAFKHQANIFVNNSPYKDVLIAGRVIEPLNWFEEFGNYEDLLNDHFSSEDNEKLRLIKFVEIGHIKYKPGLLIELDSIFYQIDFIAFFDSNCAFLCSKCYIVNQYETFLNSLELKEIQNYKLIKHTDLKNLNVYEKRYFKDKIYLIAKDLELYRIYY